MIIVIKRTRQEVDLKIHTVSLSHTKSNEMLLFRCIFCGTAISQYLGKVCKIYPFVEPSMEVLKIDKCKECGALYTFQTVEYKHSGTKIILERDKQFACFTCREPIIPIATDNMKLPFEVKCPTRDCSEVFDFIDVV